MRMRLDVVGGSPSARRLVAGSSRARRLRRRHATTGRGAHPVVRPSWVAAWIVALRRGRRSWLGSRPVDEELSAAAREL